MAVAIPVVAAFASGAVSAVVAGTATMAAYATVAGAVLSTVGAITGKKDVMKVGALLSLGGGLGAAFGNGMSTAASTASSASAAEAASQFGDGAAWGATNDIASYGGLESAGQALGQVGQAAGAATPVTSGINVPASGGLNAPAMAAPDLAQQFATQAPQAGQAAGGMSTGAAWGADAASTTGLDAVAKGAQGITGNDFNSWFQKAMAKTGSALKTTGEFVNKNKGLTELGLGAIQVAYGPEAEMVDMKRDELDYQRSLLERARVNLNSPIRLRYMGGQK